MMKPIDVDFTAVSWSVLAADLAECASLGDRGAATRMHVVFWLMVSHHSGLWHAYWRVAP